MVNYNPQGSFPFVRTARSVSLIERVYADSLTMSASHTLGQNATESFFLNVETRKVGFIFFNISAVGAGTAVLTKKIQVQDPVTTTWITLKSWSDAAGTTLDTLLEVGPYSWPADATPLFFLQTFLLPESTMRINSSCSNNAGDSITYSIGMLQAEIG